MERAMSKLAAIFPGIGYTVDKPLLYYSRRMAASHGYEVRPLPYGGFPQNVREDREKMAECYRIALVQAGEMLAGIDLTVCDDVLFIGKSIGTTVAAEIAARSPATNRIRFILYTPLEDAFAFAFKAAVVFTGTDDPWVGGSESRIAELCGVRHIPCFVISGANHSLETESPLKDIENLRDIMEETEKIITTRAVTE